MISLKERFGRWCGSFVPAPTDVNWAERARACIGSFIGILTAGTICPELSGSPGDLSLLIAPMGASAVLLFAAPASPLAQPWSILGGNLVAAVIGVTCAHWIQPVGLAAALAVGASIAAMLALRCLHPPGGAVALLAVIGGPTIQAEGYRFAFHTVGLNALALLTVALVYNNATRRRYPHPARAEHPARHGTADPPPEDRLGFTPSDLDVVLERHGEFLDISRHDLDTLFREAELQGYRRRFGDITCADIMSRDVVGVATDAPVARVWELMRRHGVTGVPVLGPDRRLVGMVTQGDLAMLSMGEGGLAATRRQSLLNRLRRMPSDTTVSGVMTAAVAAVSCDTPVTALVPLMADGGQHHVPVVDSGGALVGIVTQTDLVSSLYRGWLANQAAA